VTVASLFLAASVLVARAPALPAPPAQGPPALSPGDAEERTIPDVEVRDQDGRTLRFDRDLLSGRTVVMSFIYTTCTASCPLLGRAFADLQAALAEARRSDVYLLSLSRDPETDTPERLKEWGRRFGVKPGWFLLTGDKGAMDELLLALTGDPARRGVHSDAVLIVDLDQGIWRRESAAEPPDYYLHILEELRPAARSRPPERKPAGHRCAD
jgi:protein SCO1/2